MKRVHFFLITGMLIFLLVLSGCSGANFVAKAPTPTPIPTSTPTPTPTSTPTPTPTLSPEEQKAVDLQEKMNLAPDIEGAEKVIKEINGLKRVTYERDGEYIGEYKKEVTQTDENGKVTEVGGIALIGSEAEKILKEQLTETGSDYLIALPADISDLTTLENVNIDLSNEPFMSGPIAIRIDCGDNKVSVCNVMPGETEIRQGTYEAYGYTGSGSITNNDSDHIIEGKEMEFIYNWTKFTNSDSQFSSDFKTLTFGDTFGETINPILIAYVDMMGTGPIPIQSFNKILAVDEVLDNGTTIEVPVFVSSNN